MTGKGLDRDITEMEVETGDTVEKKERVNTGKVKLFLIIFGGTLSFTASSVAKNLIETPMSNAIRAGVVVQSLAQVLLVCNTIYCAYQIVKLIDTETVFDLKMIHHLKGIKYSLLALAVIGIINFGFRPSIAIVNIDFRTPLHITVDFNTLFLIGVALFTEVMLNVIAKGIEIKEEQELTI